MGIVIGIIIVLAIAIFLMVLTFKSKSNDLVKLLLIFGFIAFALTWVIPYGYFNAGEFTEYGMNRLGLTDIPSVYFYAAYFCLTTVIYLLVLGGFYGVLSKTSGYQALVKKCADKIKGKEILTSVAIIIVFAVLASLIRTQLALLVFVPFVVSVLLNAKFDKITAMGVAFGSVILGSLGAVFGTDGLYWFNSYTGIALKTGIYHRLIIGLIALALYIGFTIFRVIKMKKGKVKAEELKDDLFAIEDTKAKAKTWPIVLIYLFILAFVILGFIAWEANFKIEAFTKFHTWITDLNVGKDYKIFSYILGTNATAFGSFELNALIVILLITSLIVGLMGRISLKEFGENFAEGINKIGRPVMLYVLAYAVFIVMYMTPYFGYITNWAFNLTKAFNPYIAIFTSAITSIFHADLGFTGYIVSDIFVNKYAANASLLHTIYLTTYGMMQIFAPTSGLLLIGLGYLKLDYKSWFKYIWIFVLAMLIVLIIFASIVNYAM